MTAPTPVVIKLTEGQRETIKKTTGQDVEELKIEQAESRESPLRFTAETARKAPTGMEIPGVDKQVDSASPKLG